MSPSDTIVWVTGASAGLGAAIAAAVPDPAAHVVNIGRRPNPATENVLCDLSAETDWARVADHFAESLIRRRARRAILVNNAVSHRGVDLVAAQPMDVVRDQLTVNVTAPLTLCSGLIRACTAAGSVSADLVLISSVNAVEPLPGFATYGASKAALEQWVRTVRQEPASGPPGFRAIGVRPGPVDTPGLRAATELGGALAPLADEVKSSLARGNPAAPAVIAERLWSAVWSSWPTEPVISLG